MSKIKQIFINRSFPILIFIFILIRLPFLDQIFLLHDERDIVFSGYSIAKTGKDLFGNAFPINFTGISPNNPLFAIYFSAIWSYFISVRSVFLARLPFILMSSLLMPLTYLFVLEITKDKKKSLLTSIILCFSPWVFHITRLSFEISLAIVTLLGGILLLFKNKRLLAYLLFFITFYTYQGFRLLIPFLLIYCELFFLLQKNKNIKQFIFSNIIHIVFIIVLLFSAGIIDPGVTQNRMKEVIFFSQKASDEVIFRRNTSIALPILQKVMDNKIFVSFDYMLTNLIKGSDLIYLFKEGDYSAINGNIASGQFFFISIMFFFLGIAYLGRKIHSSDLFLIGFSVVGMIPSLLSINGSSFSIRSMLSGIGFAYIIALGTIFGYSIIEKTKFFRIILSGLIILFIINLTYVSYIYFFRRPITVSELFNENERTFYSYLQSHKSDSKIIYSPLPQDIYLSIAYLDNNLSMNQIQKEIKQKSPLIWNNYIFVQCNHTMQYLTFSNVIISKGCLSPEQYGYFDDINNKKVKEKVKYKDYSTQTAYFILR